MTNAILTRTVNAVREAVAPKFRCRTCRNVHPKTIFDRPEADGTYICQACEIADYQWHREMNAHLFDDIHGAGVWDRG